MSSESGSKKYVSIDDIRRDHPITPQRLAEFHGVTLPSIKENGDELRMPCPFPGCPAVDNCSQTISIKSEARGFVWKCFRYGCGKGGNDVAFNDLIRDNLGDGHPRGARFKENLRDYQQLAAGESRQAITSTQQPSALRSEPIRDDEDAENIPLQQSDNENARLLVNLPKKFLTDQGKMPPYAASYERRRPWFQDPEQVLAEWEVGYLPKGTPGDKVGGTMRDKIVFPIRDQAGQLLAFCGRDPDWERKHADWLSLSEEKKSQEKEPAKWRFPSKKMFRKGRELWGQDGLSRRGIKRQLREQGGLWVVEGPGDVINLSRANIKAVGLMWNDVTPHQANKLARYAWDLCDGRLVSLFDLDEEGRQGMWRFLQKLSKLGYVRAGWSSEGGTNQWANKQPEQLDLEQMERLKESVLSEGKPKP